MRKSAGRQAWTPATAAIRTRYLAAVELQRAARLAEAEAGYRWVLERVPAHFDAMHLLGVVRAQREDYDEALQWLTRAVRLHDRSAAAFHNLANAQHALRRFDDALASVERALALDPSHVRAWRSRSHVLRDMRRLDDALESLERALAIEPGYVDAMVDRGDLVRWLQASDARFDLAVAADVFVYIGDLNAVFGALRRVLRPGALVAFSCEAGHDAPVTLGATLRYAHSADYLRRMAEAHGFTVAATTQCALRRDAGAEVAGHLQVWRSPG